MIEIDPDYSAGYTVLADCLKMELRHGWAKSPEESKQQVKEIILKALEMDDSDAYADQLLAEMHLIQRNYDAALVEYKKTVDLEPNSSFALWFRAR